MGSPAYMSPEQVRSTKDVDARADIWSLGAILHELLSGKEPWTGGTSADTFAMILTEPAPPLRTIDPSVDLDLEAVVLRCLEKDPEVRFQTVADLAMALVRFVPHRNHSIAPTWDPTRPHTPISDIPSAQCIPLVDQQRLAALDSQKLAQLDSQRILTPPPTQAWQPPPSSGHVAIAPILPALPATTPSAQATPPWWRLPALLGAAFGLLVLGVIVLVATSRSRPDAMHPSAVAPTETVTPLTSPAMSASTPSPEGSMPTEAPTVAAAPDPPPAISPKRPGAAPAKPKSAVSGIPRHRTDW
jgi:serine/threonine-protein kinase